MFAVAGFIMRGEAWSPKEAWEIADEMIEARKEDDGEELGIAAVKPKRKYLRRSSR